MIPLFYTFLWFVFPFLFAFNTSPYLSNIFELNFQGAASYRYFPSIQGATSSFSAHTYELDFLLSGCFIPNWDFTLGLDFIHSRNLSWGVERGGISSRTLLQNDIAGDPVSLAAIFSFYYVPSRNLRAPASPYHAPLNGELGLSLGKEIAPLYKFLYQVYLYGGFGLGSQKKPWLRAEISNDLRIRDNHFLLATLEGYFGLGSQTMLKPTHFSGYGLLAHRSLDLSLSYRYHFSIWGKLTFRTFYRVYAHLYPKHERGIQVSYILPFAPF